MLEPSGCVMLAHEATSSYVYLHVCLYTLKVGINVLVPSFIPCACTGRDAHMHTHIHTQCHMRKGYLGQHDFKNSGKKRITLSRR
jgi:hypothetical protein